MLTLTVGVDISKLKIDVAIILPESTKTVNLGQYKNRTCGFRKLSARINQIEKGTPFEKVVLVLEPTGGYEHGLATFAYEERKWDVVMPNPYKVRKWAQSAGVRVKTDSMDACILARYIKQVDKFHFWKPLPEDINVLSELLKRKNTIEASIQQEKNRLESLNYRDINQKIIIDSVDRYLQFLRQELATLEDNIKQIVNDNPSFKEQARRLKTVPGIGERNCFHFLAFFHRWNNISDGSFSKNLIVGYVGLDPTAYESGTTVYRPAHISRKGSPEIRSRLYMSALGGVRGNNPLKYYYQCLLQRAKPKKVALVACARKVLVWAWFVFKTNTDFDPSRFQYDKKLAGSLCP